MQYHWVMTKEMDRDEYIRHLFERRQEIQGRMEHPDKRTGFKTILTKTVEKVIAGIQTRIIKN